MTISLELQATVTSFDGSLPYSVHPGTFPLGSFNSLFPDAPMAFVNEVVSDSDIDKYGLPFKKGSGRYWTRDAERDMYLWGGMGGNPAYGEQIMGTFYLYIDQVLLRIALSPGEGSISYSESPFVVSWESIYSIYPFDMHGLDKHRVCSVLKEALQVYGHDGGQNLYTPIFVTKFGF